MASLTHADHIELETTLQQLALDLVCDAIETDMAFGHYWLRLLWAGGHCGRHGGQVCDIIC